MLPLVIILGRRPGRGPLPDYLSVRHPVGTVPTPGSENLAKEYAMKQSAISFRNWRSELNTKYLKKGKDPTRKYKITPAQWALFGEQKMAPEFLAKSKMNSGLAKKNIYKHRLGTSGYKHQIPGWKAEEAAKKAAGLR